MSSRMLQRCLYTWSLMPSEKCYIKPLKSTGCLSVVNTREYLVKDLFCGNEDDMDQRAEKIGEFQSGYWEQTMRDTFREAGIKEDKVKEICE